jgi:hypothetical protein
LLPRSIDRDGDADIVGDDPIDDLFAEQALVVRLAFTSLPTAAPRSRA